MSSDIAKPLFWIVLVLAFSAWAIGTHDVVLGLDLRGGVTLRYELETPDLAQGGDAESMIETTIDTLRARIDTYGIRESSTARQGEREIVIELPGSGPAEAESVKTLVSRVGRLEWRIRAFDDPVNGLNVTDETKRLEELLAANAGKGPEEVDVTTLDRAFPDVRSRWVPYSSAILAAARGLESLDDAEDAFTRQPLTPSDYELLRIEQGAARTFTGADIGAARQSVDQRGNPAVGVTITAGRSAEFGDWTEENKGQLLGLVLDGRMAQPPATINERLDRDFVIMSGKPTGFTTEEIRNYLTIIRSGSLQMKPRLLFENTIGPSLGESSIETGVQAGLWGLLAVVLFTIGYYRLNGTIAIVCLLFNLITLVGLLMFLRATITLPGMAGLVLTLGMAIDSNILIFERLREETDRSKGLAQAIKLGFEKATSTIVDANVTGFLTAFILFKLGSGPVQGFAVVLMLGILTSVFSVLVFGKTVYMILLDREWLKKVTMGRFIKQETSIPFMSKTRLAMRVSTVAVAASLVGFVLTGTDTYGLDFLGGYKAQVRLSRPATQGEVQQAVGADFHGAQVVSVLDETEDADRSTRYVIKVKAVGADAAMADGDANPDVNLAERYEQRISTSLGELLVPEFVTGLLLTPDEATVSTRLAATLHFQGPVEAAQVAPSLGFLSQLETAPGEHGGVRVAGVLPGVGLEAQQVVQRFVNAVARADDLPPRSEPFIESTTIGSRVGVELRDSAIRAVLLSFAVIIIYIRVRFKEYRYGIAAIIALFHDVSITLGIVALVHYLGAVDIEIDLPMIAAFLTIVGYSLNDTIVLFDRVRENLPRLDKPIDEVLDISMNQVLARTLLTSVTTLLVLGVIFYFSLGEQHVLEGFSFAMIVGVLVGTYSSIFIASPIVAMLARRAEGAKT